MSTSKAGRYLAILGTACQLGSVVGLIGAMIGMANAFKTLGGTHSVSDPAVLSGGLGYSLFITAIGFFVGLIGLILLIIALTASRYRARWFFWFLVIYGVLLLFFFPSGTAFGLFFLVYCLTKTQEFLAPAPSLPPASPLPPPAEGGTHMPSDRH